MKTFSFSIPQMLVLNQMLQVPLWVGAPLEDASSNQKLSTALDELESAGWIARQVDGSVGIAEGLLAILQAVRDAQTIAFAACLRKDAQIGSLTVFLDSGHYVVQTWQESNLVELVPSINQVEVKAACLKELNHLAALKDADRLEYRVLRASGGTWNAQENPAIDLGSGRNGAPLSLDAVFAAFQESL